ncbi:MAG: hypothetical protein ABIJ52_17705 [Pseudomonadota bacterium]
MVSTVKKALDLKQVYHRDERIEAHVFQCFLALLLVRIAISYIAAPFFKHHSATSQKNDAYLKEFIFSIITDSEEMV